MVDVFVHRTGLDTAAVDESRDLVQVVSDGGKLPCDGFDLVRVDIEHILDVLETVLACISSTQDTSLDSIPVYDKFYRP